MNGITIIFIHIYSCQHLIALLCIPIFRYFNIIRTQDRWKIWVIACGVYHREALDSHFIFWVKRIFFSQLTLSGRNIGPKVSLRNFLDPKSASCSHFSNYSIVFPKTGIVHHHYPIGFFLSVLILKQKCMLYSYWQKF